MSTMSVPLGVITGQLFRWRTAKKPACQSWQKQGPGGWFNSTLHGAAPACSATAVQAKSKLMVLTWGWRVLYPPQGSHGKALLPEMCSYPGLQHGWHLQTEALTQGSIHTSLKAINRTRQKQPPDQLHKFCMGQEQNPVCLVLPGLCVMLPIKCLAKWHSWLSFFPQSLFSLTPILSLFFGVLRAWTALTLHLSAQPAAFNLKPPDQPPCSKTVGACNAKILPGPWTLQGYFCNTVIIQKAQKEK